MTLMLKLLRRLCDRFEVTPESADEARAVQLTQETNVFQLVETLQRELPEIEKK